MSKADRLQSNDKHLELVRSLPSDHVARVDLALTVACLDTSTKVLSGDRAIAASALALLFSQKRRITSIGNDNATKLIFHSVFANDNTYVDCLLMSGVERSLFTPFFTRALETRRRAEVMPQFRHLTYLVRLLDRFKSLVVERFEPLVDKHASAHVWGRRQHGILVESADVFQNHRLAVIRSTDKFDSSRGALTSYVGMWMKNAPHSSFSLAAGESFSLTRNARALIQKGRSDINNHSLPIDDALAVMAEESDAPEQESAVEDSIRNMHSLVDKMKQAGRLEEVKYALAALLYPFDLTESQKQALSRTMNPPTPPAK